MNNIIHATTGKNSEERTEAKYLGGRGMRDYPNHILITSDNAQNVEADFV